MSMSTDYRKASFKNKFANAGKHLGVPHDQIISLKFRDMVSSYSEYHEMLRLLEYETGVPSSPIQDDLQGRGHLVGHGDQKVIVVEHETGLEILYIAGSVASIIGIIPLVLRSWNAIRGNLAHRHARHIDSVEIRRIDTVGNLREEHSHGPLLTPSLPPDVLNGPLFSAAQTLESELKAVRVELQSNNERLAAIEKKLKTSKAANVKKRPDKKSSNKPLKKDAAKTRRAS
ncbi:MAG: hypothetical protein M1418_04045 [Deltaproteobacteria bacterium]|nr:hypothetical protein [Deltaproteobacteria bacterium]